jgi:hypothetical protein
MEDGMMMDGDHTMDGEAPMDHGQMDHDQMDHDQ